MHRKHRKSQRHFLRPILEHVARYQLTTLRALCQVPAFQHTPPAVLRRRLRTLQRTGRLQSVPLFHNHDYYCLTARDGDPSRARPFSEPVKLRAYAMLLFCCLGDASRERLTRRELETHFPQLYEPGLPLHYYVDTTGEVPRLGFLRVDVGGYGRWDRVLGKARHDVLKHEARSGFRELIRQRRFEITILTALPQKAARICDTIRQESHSLDACVRVSAASELLYLIAPPQD